ncbi:MAG: DUF2079 domain-containing protein [Nannocystaceae bacterium]|nr:DUF2079 domain-containing protein [bacterium]
MHSALALAIGVMPGVAIAQLRGATWVDDAGTVLRFALASVLVVGLGYGGALRRAADKAGALRRINLRALPLLGAPIVGLLLDPEVASTRGGLILAAIAGWSIMVGASRLRGRDPSPRRRHRVHLLGVVGAAAFVGVWLARIAWIRHASLQTNTYDFGLFVNAIWNTSRGDLFVCTLVPTGSILDEHVSLALVPLALVPRLGLPPFALLALQSLWICAGAVPLYVLARRHVGVHGGLTFALAYLLHPSVHANALWDFHPLSFAAPLLMTLILYGDRRRLHPMFVLSAAGLLMLREEMAFVLIAYAVCVAIGGRIPRAVGLAAASVAFLLVLNAVMGQTSSHVARYADIASRGGGGLPGMVMAVLFDPAFILGYALTYSKVVYIGVQSVSVLGLAALTRRAWPMLALAVAFSLLATSRHVYNPFFHYTSMLYPVVLAWAPSGVSRLAAMRWSAAPLRLRRAAILAAIVTASMLTSLTYGGLHDNDVFRAGFRAPRREISRGGLDRLAWLEAHLDAIPQDAAIAATGRVGPHVATRPHVYAYPTDEPVDVMVVFAGDLRREHKADLRAAVASGEWVLESASGSLQIYRRR